MELVIALLYIAAVVLLLLAAVGVSARVNLVILGAALALLAFATPSITAGF